MINMPSLQLYQLIFPIDLFSQYQQSLRNQEQFEKVIFFKQILAKTEYLKYGALQKLQYSIKMRPSQHNKVKIIELRDTKIKLPINLKQTWMQAMQQNIVLVDKSQFIMCMHERLNIITLPKLWGKSLNLQMLYKYLSYPLSNSKQDQQKQHNQTLEIFKKLNIYKISSQPINEQGWNYFQHNFGSCIVFYLDFKFSKQLRKREEILKQIDKLMESSFIQYRKIFQAKKWNFAKIQQHIQKRRFDFALEQMQIPTKSHYFPLKKVLIIDNYDYCYNQCLEDGAEQSILQQIAKTINDFLNSVSGNVSKVIIAGIRDIIFKKKGYFNQTDDSLYRSRFGLGKCFGFTEAEVKEQLIQKIFKNQSEAHKRGNEQVMKAIKDLYKGYYCQQEEDDQNEQNQLYCPYSVIKYLYECIQFQKTPTILNLGFQNSERLYFWANAALSTKPIQNYLNWLHLNHVYELLEVIAKSSKKAQIRYGAHVKNQIMQSLLFNGYLTQQENEPLSIPNQEVRHLFLTQILKFLSKKEAGQLLEGNIKYIKNSMSKFRITCWDTCKQQVEFSICKSMKYASKFNSRIFNSHFLAAIFNKISQHKILFDYQRNRIRTCVMLCPKDQNSRKFIIHSQKALRSHVSDVKQDCKFMQKATIEYALFQILKSNYLKAALKFKNWDQIIIRVLVCTQKSIQLNEIQSKQETKALQGILAKHQDRCKSAEVHYELQAFEVSFQRDVARLISKFWNIFIAQFAAQSNKFQDLKVQLCHFRASLTAKMFLLQIKQNPIIAKRQIQRAEKRRKQIKQLRRISEIQFECMRIDFGFNKEQFESLRQRYEGYVDQLQKLQLKGSLRDLTSKELAQILNVNELSDTKYHSRIVHQIIQKLITIQGEYEIVPQKDYKTTKEDRDFSSDSQMSDY